MSDLERNPVCSSDITALHYLCLLGALLLGAVSGGYLFGLI